MSEKSSTFQENVKVFGEWRSKIMKSESVNHVLEVFSTLLWVDMILWAELLSLIVYAYIFVSKIYQVNTNNLLK